MLNTFVALLDGLYMKHAVLGGKVTPAEIEVILAATLIVTAAQYLQNITLANWRCYA